MYLKIHLITKKFCISVVNVKGTILDTILYDGIPHPEVSYITHFIKRENSISLLTISVWISEHNVLPPAWINSAKILYYVSMYTFKIFLLQTISDVQEQLDAPNHHL
jgi:hypothetical protein